MRIISGTRRGKKLFAPKNDRIRPTSDRAREALFNILESMLPAPLSEYDFLTFLPEPEPSAWKRHLAAPAR